MRTLDSLQCTECAGRLICKSLKHCSVQAVLRSGEQVTAHNTPGSWGTEDKGMRG